jgi:hypothetical protein
MAALALMAAGADSGSAQSSFFNKRYCAQAGGSNSGSGLDCSFNTLEQCRMSLSGSRYCTENPFWKPEAPVKRRGTARE